jgi:arylsulfatase A-like enzyme
VASSDNQPGLEPSYKKLSLLLGVVMWFALLTGLAEASLLAFRKFVQHRTIVVSPHVVWMAPLADLLLFTLAVLGLSLVARRWPKAVSLPSVAFVLASLGFSSLLLMYSRLHPAAAMLLALGLGLQTARFLREHDRAFQALVRRTLVWLVALILLLGVGVQAWATAAERRALAQLPPAPAGAPNVLLIVLDTVRAKSLSLYGYRRRTTPRLENWAKNGVRFERALSTSPWTLPSHGSLFTGRFPHEMSADWLVPLDGAHPTLAEALASLGYSTVGFAANLHYCSYEHGLQRGFAHYEDYPISFGQIVLSSSLGRTITNNRWFRRLTGYQDLLNRKTAAEVNRAFLSWLPGRRERPFFAFLNYYDAHEPYLPPAPFKYRFDPAPPRRSFVYRTNEAQRADRLKMSPSEVQAEIDAYEAAIAYVDHQVGLLLDQLRTRGLMENTLVVVTSDHGEHVGERHGRRNRLFSHGQTLYIEALHVPLLILFPPRVPAGRTVPGPVTLRDIPVTVLELIDLNAKIDFPGRSLTRHWSEPALAGESRDTLLAETTPVGKKGHMKSLVAGDRHYIRARNGAEELYDLGEDHLELKNLAQSEKGRATSAAFRRSLELRLGELLPAASGATSGKQTLRPVQLPPRPLPPPPLFSTE